MMRSNFIGRLICVGIGVATLLLATNSLRADTAYSNLGPNDEFGGGANILIGNFSASAPNTHYANQFTSEATGAISTVDVAVSLSDPGDNDFLEVLIFDDSANRPGSMLWSGTIQPQFSSEVISVASEAGPLEIHEGTTYWVSARSLNGTSTYIWHGNSIGAEGRFTFDSQGGTNWRPPNEFAQQAFRVNLASAVPEPTSGLAAALLACLILIRRGHRRF